MIVSFILDLGFNFVRSLFGTVEYDAAVFEAFLGKIFEIIKVACYLLPMGTVSFIFGFTMVLLIYRIGISLLSTLWRILPLV